MKFFQTLSLEVAYLPKVKPSAGPLFLSKKTSRDMESVLKNVKEIKW